jgi:hypothetical protein
MTQRFAGHYVAFAPGDQRISRESGRPFGEKDMRFNGNQSFARFG